MTVPTQAVPAGTTAEVRRPQLKPALRRLWRGPATLQLGIAPRHALVLSGVRPADLRVLDLLDGTRTLDQVTAQAESGHATDVRRLVAALTAAGALDDAAAPGPLIDEAQRQRLEPDRLALSLTHRRPGAAAEVLRRRHEATVTVHGAGRLGATVATLLAAAGIGRLGCVDDAPVDATDLAPGGIRARVSGPRGAALVADLAASGVHATAAPVPDADLAIVATVGSPAPELLRAVRRGPHLLVTVQETTATVGPLVVPGHTPCLRCQQLHRGDRDPAWPALAAQLVGSRPDVEPCDVVLATLAASVAAGQALAWIGSDDAPPASAGGVLEIDPAELSLRRRSLVAHPACGCGAADSD